MACSLLALTLILLPQADPGTAPASPDTTGVREAARSAEAAYERAARRFAPFTGWSSGGSDCDEIVGRFCLRFDTGAPDTLPSEPARITDARRAAIDTLRRAFGVLPAAPEVSGPLTRLLIEDGRPREAVAVALTFAALSPDTLAGLLLEGFALHAAGEDSAAARRFDGALARMSAEEVARVRALDWLLEDAERGRYDDLDETARREYERDVWLLSDPLYLTPANERWTEHVARYAYARLLESRPVVRDMARWGRDLEELTMRYGVAQRRGRQHGARFDQSGIVEYYDPEQLHYIVADLLTAGVPPAPPPGAEWRLRAPRARSGHAPASIRSMAELPHQLARIPVPDGWLVVVSATFGLDSLARRPPEPLPGDTARRAAPDPVDVDAGLWLLDVHAPTAEGAAARARFALDGDSADVALQAYAPPGEYVYAIEGMEPATRTARRARYALTLESIAGLRVSDVIVARPFDDAHPSSHRDSRLRPYTHLEFAPDARIGIYAEALAEPGMYAVEVSIRRAERGSLPGRLFRWLGRSLGLTDAPTPPRVAWEVEHHGDERLVVALDLALRDLQEGLHVIEIAVTNPRTGDRALGGRLVRIE